VGRIHKVHNVRYHLADEWECRQSQLPERS
jgi:hypothetical protein